MAGNGTDRSFTIIIIAALLFLGLCFISLTALAQSPATPSPSPFPDNTYIVPGTAPTSVPGTMIEGLVLDQDGNPVPNATVTLLLDGEKWHKYPFAYGRGGTNPQATFIYDDNSGSAEGAGVYYFGYVDPGNYTVVAAKDGYKGFATVNASKDSLMGAYTVNVILDGYHERSFSTKELALTGGITGVIQANDSAEQGRILSHVYVTLWQDGQLVDTPKNPQNSGNGMITQTTGNYLFEHLAPGYYDVMVETIDLAGVNHNMTKSTTVGRNVVNVSFLLTGMIFLTNPSLLPPTATPGPAMVISESPLPTQTRSGTPAPFPGLTIILTALGIAALFVYRHKK
jgi:hypothetical protein